MNGKCWITHLNGHSKRSPLRLHDASTCSKGQTFRSLLEDGPVQSLILFGSIWHLPWWAVVYGCSTHSSGISSHRRGDGPPRAGWPSAALQNKPSENTLGSVADLGFPKIGVPPVIIHFNGIFLYKPSILGYQYPHLWKPPFASQFKSTEELEIDNCRKGWVTTLLVINMAGGVP